MDTNMKQLRDPEEIRQHIRDIYKENRFMSDYFIFTLMKSTAAV